LEDMVYIICILLSYYLILSGILGSRFMTRINVGISVSELPMRLLLAEHRELKRIPNMVRQGRVNLENIPRTFRLGEGHVSFFYDKLGYLRTRYEELYSECVMRGYDVTYYGDSFEGIPSELMGGYEASEYDRGLLLDRIHSRGFQLTWEEAGMDKNSRAYAFLGGANVETLRDGKPIIGSQVTPASTPSHQSSKPIKKAKPIEKKVYSNLSLQAPIAAPTAPPVDLDWKDE
jgi:deoxyribonuclease (pyrimidine dimer)